MSAPQILRRRARAASLLAIATALLGACVFDPDDRCGDNQVVFGDNLRCVCAPGYAPSDAGCVACGDNEVPSAAGCVCAEGFTRANPTAACEASGSIGADCDEETPCADSVYSYCELDGGYCTTSGCESSADCDGGYACDTSSEPAVCRRPPVGLGNACSTDADCAGAEATYCDTFMTRQCLVQGCSVTPNDCFEGYICCDFAPFVPQPLCIPGNSCQPP